VDKKIGPIEQMSVLDGEVIQIGGRDETINIHIKSGDQVHFCVTSKAIARPLAPYILGGRRPRTRQRRLGSPGVRRMDGAC
jgi:hypothetical protein